MSDIPEAKSNRISYENFAAECPLCGCESIFNRASDLRTLGPIEGRDVLCQSTDCGKPFRIGGDLVSGAHEMLVLDCYELLERKHYMMAVLSLAQAYEVFFSLFFRVEFLYRPSGANPGHDYELSDLNQLSEALHEKIKKYTFAPLRALFLRHMVPPRPEPKSLAEAASFVEALDWSGDPEDVDIDSIAGVKVVPLLKALKATTINSLRNRVVHKQAYRPTRHETEVALEEACSILFPLTRHLDLHDEINWYMRAP